MDKKHIQLLAHPSRGAPFPVVTDKGKTTAKYDGKVIIKRRRALVGRPQGTECGNSCTCS